ncbi:uncharacterized protein LOC141878864 isoform X2 [Acropora palmata]|uniref:uncharacterized protein LOC141878864 isoform X2 n=1 Tax=Acropora palmata TaxID=6131 RepID=UPI003DA11CD2
MPTSKVNINRCGTHYPIWLDGTTGAHPTRTTDPVANIKACINIWELRGGCFRHFTVGVKLCPGNFFVYYLQKITGCYAAYCAGDGQPCPYGQTGTSLSTCSALPQKFPSLYLGFPKISVKDEPENEIVSLLCIVPIHEKVRQWKNVSYEIEWYTDGKRSKFTEKPFCKPQNGQNQSSFPCPGDKEIHSLLNGTRSLNYYEPGQRITCKVKAKFTNNPLHPWSDTVTIQRPFFAGIHVSPTTLLISECKDPFFHEITLTPTIPVRRNSMEKALSVTFYLPKGLWLVNKEKCSVQLEGTKSVTVKVGATCTTLYGLKKFSVITPKITNDPSESKFWGFFGLPTIWVTVLQKNQPLHKCMSVTDPHILVLHKVDGPQRWHDFYGHEEYLLYRNQERNFEVQTKQWACNRQGITCNCGVVIRDHNDLISFSCCGNPPKAHRDDFTPVSVDIPRKKCLAPGITITQLIKGFNTKYEVIVPTGIKVIVERNYWGIDVTIYTPRAKHSQNEAGLCTYSGNDGDITHLAWKYRLTASTSYFQTLPEEINKDARPFETSCACHETQDQALTTECEIDGIPVVSFIRDTTRTYNRIKMCDNKPVKTQKIKDIEGSDDFTHEDLKDLMDPLKSNESLWEGTPVVSKDNATQYCAERLLETKVGKLCAKLGTNVQALVNVCSADIEYTGDFSFAIGAVSVLINECQDLIIENMTVNTNETNNETKPAAMPPALEEVFRLLCPNDCTFNGKCVNGSCVCNKDYTADDCSISIYQRPTIKRIQSNGLCDKRKRPCEKTTVQGRDFLNSTNMTCHIREIEVVNSSWIPNKNETKYQGTMTDLLLVECLLPSLPVLRMRYNETIEGTPAAGLMISVSNNGIDKSSQELKMISFDSVCMDCNVSTGCTLKKNTCFINRYCFVPNEPNPSNWCQQCTPEISRNTWTRRQVNHPPNVTLESNYYVVYRENFKLLIEAVDPEGMPVTVSLMGGSPKKAMIRNNVLYWNVTTNQTTQFFFKATDACQASSTFNLTLTVVPCPCNNSGQCIPQEPRGQRNYRCQCPPGYTGQYCGTEMDECKSYPCLRGRCTDLLNNYSCSCYLGFEGRNCDVDKDIYIDDCVNHTCTNGASCIDGINVYSCNCTAGFTGAYCETDIDECVSHTCANGASCVDGINAYSCKCAKGFSGASCDIDIDDCVNHTCANGASCVDGINNYSCNCSVGFTGSSCETDINDCVNHTCENGAACLDGINNYACNCTTGFTGAYCETVLPQKFPSLYLGYPKISVKDEPENEIVSLLCIVPIHEKVRQWKNVTYEIEWYTDGKRSKFTEKPFCKPQNGQNQSSFPCPGDKEIHSLLNGTLSLNYYEPGQRITCKVKAKFTNHALHPWSDHVAMQQPFFAGINVSPTTLVISECTDPLFHNITLTPTIPVRRNSRGDFVSVTFYLPKGLWLVNKEKCSVQLEGTKPVTVQVGATCTMLYGLKKFSVITPKITNNLWDSRFWRAFGLPTIWVTVLQKDQPVHKCLSVTDPHIRPLHKLTSPPPWRHFFGHEEYLLYRNKERNFEVQTKQWSCNRQGITCNCGVVIRDHNDLISFSCCGNPPKVYRDDFTPISVDIPRKKCLAPGITMTQLIKGVNSIYEVIVPTGIKVGVERNYWGIDVAIYTPRTKHSQDEAGLCTYSGNDVYITHHAWKYRLTASTSYFQTLPAEINKDARPFETSCACDETQDKALTTKCAIDGIPVDWPTDKSKHYNRIKMCDRNPEKDRKRRDIEGSDELTHEDFEVLMTPLKSNEHHREKRSVVSRDNATRYCTERLLETRVAKLCAKLGTNVQALVNVCSADIEYTGDFSFAIGAVSMLMNECEDVVIENVTINSNETNNVTKPTIPLALEKVLQLLCPNDCTFNGKCVNGSCVCNKDYTADDCSISVYQRPTITRIQSNGLCDRRKRPCEKTTVQGRDFLNSTNITCHLREIEIVNSSWIPNKNETKYRGTMTDLVLVECLLPSLPVLRMRFHETIEGTPAAGLMISVSNNGIDKSSQELQMISFDSVCMDCNVSAGCTLKKNTCFINRYCFAPNEPNPRDWCQQCIPEVNTSSWTKRQVNHPPNVIMETTYYVVYKEIFILPIEAVDPEGMPITVSLIGGSPKKARIQNNVLYWNVPAKQTTQFFFKATDACQASSTFNMTLTVVPCPCNNSGQCVPQEPRGQGNYTCQCSPGYTGQYCSVEIDECASYPCLRGRCTDLLNNYSCSCYLGFEGRNCEVDKDYCESSPCVNGNCTDEVSGYTCNCLPGYSGFQCEVNIDECTSSPCLNNGTCIDQVNSFKCQCVGGYKGHNCSVKMDECRSSPCVNGVPLQFTPSSSSTSSPPETVSSIEITTTTRNVVEYSFKIRLLKNWTDDLKDKNSDAFKDLKNVLKEELMNKLRKTTNIIDVNVVSFSKGSIVAEFKLIFHMNDEPKDAYGMLKGVINDGNLGALRVDPSSLKEIPPPTKEPTTETNRQRTAQTQKRPDKELTYAIIIGVSLGGLFVAVLCIIFFVRFCKNRNAAHRRKRASYNKPPEEACPHSEKYELKSVAVNNAYVAVGEVSFRCDEQTSGFSNEGFQ